MYFYLLADTSAYNGTHNLNCYTHTATGNTLGQVLYLEMEYYNDDCTFTTYDENGTQMGQTITTKANSPREVFMSIIYLLKHLKFVQPCQLLVLSY